MDDEDALLQGGEERESDLDTVAVAAARNRRQKQKATLKATPKKMVDTESDTDLPDSKRSKTCLTRSVAKNRAEQDATRRAAKDASHATQRAAKDATRRAAKDATRLADRPERERGRERM